MMGDMIEEEEAVAMVGLTGYDWVGVYMKFMWLLCCVMPLCVTCGVEEKVGL